MPYPHLTRGDFVNPFPPGDEENDENKIGHALRGRFRFDARPGGVWGSARAGTGTGGPGGPGGTRPSRGSGTGGRTQIEEQIQEGQTQVEEAIEGQ